MSTPVYEQKNFSAEDADVECSTSINWPAIYVLGGLMLATVIANAWMWAYISAANIGLLLVGGALILTGRMQEKSGKKSRYWRWSGYAAYAVVGILSLVRLAQAWMAHSGS